MLDYWESIVRPDSCVVIKVEPDEGEIIPNRSSKVNVTVFANTWGKYFDKIEVKIHSLPTFHLPVYIEVTGRPVFFTFAPDIPEPTLR